MTTKQLPALPQGELVFTPEDTQVIKDSVLPQGSSTSDLKLFLAQCTRTKLDPLSRQIYAFKQGGRLVIGTSIDGFRIIAERSGKYEGQVGPFWCGADGIWKDVWLDAKPPAAAKVGVYKTGNRETLWAVALYSAYCGPGPQWERNSPNQLSICAERLALRKAFPNDLSGLYGKEEMSNGEETAPEGKHTSAVRVQVEEAVEVHEQVDKGEEEVLQEVQAPKKNRSNGEEDKTKSWTRVPRDVAKLGAKTQPAILVKTEEVEPGDFTRSVRVEPLSKERLADIDAQLRAPEIPDELFEPSPEADIVTEEDIQGLLTFTESKGYTEEEVSEFVETTFKIDDPSTLTQVQLKQIKHHFSKQKVTK